MNGFNLDSEAVSLKTQGNRVYQNTLQNAIGSAFVTRAASYSQILCNTFIHSGGGIDYGDYNVWIGNRFIRSNIKVMAGDATYRKSMVATCHLRGRTRHRTGSSWPTTHSLAPYWRLDGRGRAQRPTTTPTARTCPRISSATGTNVTIGLLNGATAPDEIGYFPGAPIANVPLTPADVGRTAADIYCD